MFYAFNNKFYKKYAYAINMSIGGLLLIFSIIFLVYIFDLMFGHEIIDLNNHISSSENINKDLPINQKVILDFSTNHGCFYHDRETKMAYNDYFLVELDDGSLIAISTEASDEKKIVSNGFTGYVRFLKDDVNTAYRQYISELKDKGIVKSDSQIIMAVVNSENAFIGPVVCFLISFLARTSLEFAKTLM